MARVAAHVAGEALDDGLPDREQGARGRGALDHGGRVASVADADRRVGHDRAAGPARLDAEVARRHRNEGRRRVLDRDLEGRLARVSGGVGGRHADGRVSEGEHAARGRNEGQGGRRVADVARDAGVDHRRARQRALLDDEVRQGSDRGRRPVEDAHQDDARGAVARGVGRRQGHARLAQGEHGRSAAAQPRRWVEGVLGPSQELDRGAGQVDLLDLERLGALDHDARRGGVDDEGAHEHLAAVTGFVGDRGAQLVGAVAEAGEGRAGAAARGVSEERADVLAVQRDLQAGGVDPRAADLVLPAELDWDRARSQERPGLGSDHGQLRGEVVATEVDLNLERSRGCVARVVHGGAGDRRRSWREEGARGGRALDLDLAVANVAGGGREADQRPDRVVGLDLEVGLLSQDRRRRVDDPHLEAELGGVPRGVGGGARDRGQAERELGAAWVRVADADAGSEVVAHEHEVVDGGPSQAGLLHHLARQGAQHGRSGVADHDGHGVRSRADETVADDEAHDVLTRRQVQGRPSSAGAEFSQGPGVGQRRPFRVEARAAVQQNGDRRARWRGDELIRAGAGERSEVRGQDAHLGPGVAGQEAALARVRAGAQDQLAQVGIRCGELQLEVRALAWAQEHAGRDRSDRAQPEAGGIDEARVDHGGEGGGVGDGERDAQRGALRKGLEARGEGQRDLGQEGRHAQGQGGRAAGEDALVAENLFDHGAERVARCWRGGGRLDREEHEALLARGEDELVRLEARGGDPLESLDSKSIGRRAVEAVADLGDEGGRPARDRARQARVHLQHGQDLDPERLLVGGLEGGTREGGHEERDPPVGRGRAVVRPLEVGGVERDRQDLAVRLRAARDAGVANSGFEQARGAKVPGELALGLRALAVERVAAEHPPEPERVEDLVGQPRRARRSERVLELWPREHDDASAELLQRVRGGSDQPLVAAARLARRPAVDSDLVALGEVHPAGQGRDVGAVQASAARVSQQVADPHLVDGGV